MRHGREIADLHVLDHAATQRVQFGHGGTSFSGLGFDGHNPVREVNSFGQFLIRSPLLRSGLVQSGLALALELSAMGAPVIYVCRNHEADCRPALLIDCLHALEEAVTLLNIPFATDSSGGSVRSKDARGFIVGDDAEYAFACTMISPWEGARA